MQAEILTLLRGAKKKYISGVEIAERLGVSRAAVWKHVQALKEAGYKIESRPRSGYSLAASPDLLVENEIKARIRTKIVGRKIFHYEKIASSNEEAKRLAQGGAEEGVVVVAEEQGSGKGRLSRGWFSPRGKGIWFSVILRPDFLPHDAPKCTLMAAVAVVRALRGFGVNAGIKWPNDVLVGGKKLVGILTEMNAEMERIHYVVIGIGVNVNASEEDFPPDIRPIATSVKIAAGKPIPRIELFAKILEATDGIYGEIQSVGFCPMLDEWRKYAVTLGQEVNVMGMREDFSGMAIDIDEDGALIVSTERGNRRVLAGDVSIRPR